ncbi:MAG: LPD1 domain-containing protein, partial [Actinomycetota bacterium]
KKSPYVSHGVTPKSAMRPEMIQAFKTAMDVIDHRRQTQAEMVKAANDDIEKSQRYIGSWLKGMRGELKDTERDGSGFDALAAAVQNAPGVAREERQALLEYMREKNGRLPQADRRTGLDNNLDWRRRYYERLNQVMAGTAVPLKLSSEYARLSTAKGPYWPRRHELFARAFESFILDKLEGQGRRSDYLVHPGKAAKEETDPDYPYPGGAERTNINAAFEKFVGSLAHKETEKGVALYSRKTERSFGQVPGLFEKPDVPVTETSGEELTAGKSLWQLRHAARQRLKTYQGESFRNADTGWELRISKDSVGKMSSRTQSADDLRAVAALPGLIENAVLAESHPDSAKDPNITAIHRFYTPLVVAGRLYRVKLTAKEGTKGGRRLYTLNAAEIEDPAVIKPLTTTQEGGVHERPAGPALSITDLLRGALRDSDGQPFAAEDSVALYSYLGERAAKTPKHALAAAREFADQGVPMEEIRKTTGWFRGKDMLWRWELSDKDAKLKDGWDGYGGTIGEALDHPTLFENYPSLAGIDPDYGITLPDNVNGGYDAKNNSIVLNPTLAKPQALSTILHELQHAVQFIEGFARGGSPTDQAFISAAATMGIDTTDKKALRGVYDRLLGEVEARDVQARRQLTAEELRDRPPYVSQGIPEEDFIVRREGDLAADESPPLEGRLLRLQARRGRPRNQKPGAAPGYKHKPAPAKAGGGQAGFLFPGSGKCSPNVSGQASAGSSRRAPCRLCSRSTNYQQA